MSRGWTRPWRGARCCAADPLGVLARMPCSGSARKVRDSCSPGTPPLVLVADHHRLCPMPRSHTISAPYPVLARPDELEDRPATQVRLPPTGRNPVIRARDTSVAGKPYCVAAPPRCRADEPHTHQCQSEHPKTTPNDRAGTEARIGVEGCVDGCSCRDEPSEPTMRLSHPQPNVTLL